MLEIRAISKSFKGHKAVNNLSFSVSKGEFFGLLGPNGAGKTTSIHMISGIMPPDEGSITIDGENLYPLSGKLKNYMGIVPQEIALYEDLSAHKNLQFWGSLYDLSSSKLKERAAYLLEWVGLTDRQHEPLKHYSGGMKRRINIAAALMHDPQLILMDEPTVGIDPQSRNKIYEMLKELHTNGKTIIYNTHYMSEAESMCDTIGIIDQGTLIGMGSMEKLRKEHGKNDTFTVQLANSYAGLELPDSIQYTFDEEALKLIITTSNLNADLSITLNHLSKASIDINDIHIAQTNLETIFLNLTGRALRE